MNMNNRVYGIVGIKAVMSNWNADFTGRPKTISNGDIFGSDKAFKYPMKRMWLNEGEKVLYIKTYKINEKGKAEEAGKLQPMDLEERYKTIFDKLDNKVKSEEVLGNLFSCIDIMNFGATFAQSGQNISITGAVQVGQGFNKYSDTMVEIQDILSPFRNSNPDKENADASSLGKKIMVDEAHYVYPFSVTPQNYNEYIGIANNFEGYSKEAYDKFKKACLVAATAFNTNSKSGCENEFAVFVQIKEGENLYLPPLDQYIEFKKGTDKNEIVFEKLAKLLSKISKSIDNIEIHYNQYTIEKPELPGVEFNAVELF